MNHASPIPGEMQVVAPAGSVLMADTRCWVSQVQQLPAFCFLPAIKRVVAAALLGDVRVGRGADGDGHPLGSVVAERG